MAVFNIGSKRDEMPDKVLVPSAFQEDIYDIIESDSCNVAIEAVAGSGKTTTIIEALDLIPKTQRTIFVAFNKSVADELLTKVPAHVQARTLHSVGFEILRRNYKKVKCNNRKVNNLLRFTVLNTKSDRMAYEWAFTNGQDIGKLISRLKGSLIKSMTKEEFVHAIDDLDLDLPIDNWSLSVYTRLLDEAWKFDGGDDGDIDFDDMLCIPVDRSNDIEFPTYDVVLVDEAQDLNTVQREFIRLLLGDTGRLIAVGDTNQAIYGFRGADHNSMSLIKKEFRCVEMPLSISYRCDEIIVEAAKEFVPHIEHREGADIGTIKRLVRGEHWGLYQNGDHILCRLNAPLVQEAMTLAKRGHNVCILGRDLVSSLLKLAKHIQEQEYNISQFSIESYYEREAALIPDSKAYKRYALADRCNVLKYVCGTAALTLKEIKQALDMIFSDRPPETPHIRLSTIHKAKGLEADRVFIIAPQYIPHPYAKGDAEIQQENNLHYVAITRAKHELYYVMDR